MKNKIRNWLLSFPLLVLAGCQKHQSQTAVFIPLSGVKAYYIENRNDTIDIFQVSHQNGVYHLAWKIYKEKRAYYINLLARKSYSCLLPYLLILYIPPFLKSLFTRLISGRWNIIYIHPQFTWRIAYMDCI